MKSWQSSAPSNIALIKYMGKLSESLGKNSPTNGSLSYTLSHLKTKVKLTLIDEPADRWQSLDEDGWGKVDLSEKGKNRFLQHLSLLKKSFGVEDKFFLVESANNFPSDCGLASSASSFAALTKAAALALNDFYPRAWANDAHVLANLSRQGSGSSCRSFFEPWSEWKGDNAKAVELPFQKLIHQAVVVEGEKKIVSSSEAHRRVTTSDLFIGRIERAEKRLQELKSAFASGSWDLAYQICWAEFWDMHALFETSKPHFGYMNNRSLEVLAAARALWDRKDEGPIVTMDAGPNVHLLWKPEQEEMAHVFEKDLLASYKVFSFYPEQAIKEINKR